MVLAPLLLQAAPALTDIGRQALPATGCAAYLWRGGPEPTFVAMAGPAKLRLRVDGKDVTLVRTAARGDARLGLPASADFAGDGLVATLDITVVSQPDLANGARVPQGTLSVTSTGGDMVVEPVVGLAACAGRMR